MDEDLTKLKEVEKQKLEELWTAPPDVAAIKEADILDVPAPPARSENALDFNPWAIFVMIAILALLFGVVSSGASIWSYWWLIFLVKPIFGRRGFRC